MIDLSQEQPIPLSQANRLVPRRPGGKPVHPSTLFRWSRTGVIGPDGARVRLEVARLGKGVYTSALAIQRFADRLARRNRDPRPCTTPASTAGLRPVDEACARRGL